MQYRRFGKTNLNLSIFSLGTMRCLASAENMQQTVHAAIQSGINHIETAQGYGKSEVYLGQAIAQGLPAPRERFYLTTKFSPALSADELDRAIDISLERLQTNYLDCVALHGINTPEHLAQAQGDRAALAGLQQAQADGRIHHIGFSTHAPLDVILAAIATQAFAFINLHYYYFFQRNAPAILQAAAQDMGIFIISPTDKGGLLYTPPAKLAELCAPLSPLEFNDHFLLKNPDITTLSIGPANPQELEWPLAIADHTSFWTEQESAIDATLNAELAAQLTADQCHQCYACLPCPEAIHIPEVLRLRNLAVALDMVPYGQYRYAMFERAGHWFPGQQGIRCTDCNDCLPRCPHHLEIPTLLKDAHQQLQGSTRRRLWE
jgi:uncharacterized protein